MRGGVWMCHALDREVVLARARTAQGRRHRCLYSSLYGPSREERVQLGQLFHPWHVPNPLVLISVTKAKMLCGTMERVCNPSRNLRCSKRAPFRQPRVTARACRGCRRWRGVVAPGPPSAHPRARGPPTCRRVKVTGLTQNSQVAPAI